MRSARSSFSPLHLVLTSALALFACDGSKETETTPTTTTTTAPEGTSAIFDLAADLSSGSAFFDMPMPSDLRLNAEGAPDYTGFPNPNNLALIEGVRKVAMDRKGFPVIPVAYFRFSGPIPAQDAEKVIAGDKASPLLLIDVDPASDERGRLFPTVAVTPEVDSYTPENLLAIALPFGQYADRPHRGRVENPCRPTPFARHAPRLVVTATSSTLTATALPRRTRRSCSRRRRSLTRQRLGVEPVASVGFP